MPVWSYVNIDKPEDLKRFEVELNRRASYLFRNIDVTQLIIALNDIDGILNLAKGGTGASLSDPDADKILFYDLSSGKTEWLNIGNGLSISDTTILFDTAANVIFKTGTFKYNALGATVTDAIIAQNETLGSVQYSPYIAVKGNAYAGADFPVTWRFGTNGSIGTYFQLRCAIPAISYDASIIDIDIYGRVGIGTIGYAKLTLPASDGAAYNAPLKFLSGTLLSTPEAGTMEFDGTNFYLTPSSVRYYVPLSVTSGISPTFNTVASSSATFTEVHASSASFGNSTSHTQFESDGTMVAIGDAVTYLDELGDVTKLKLVGVGITEDSTDATLNFDPTANLSDFIYTNMQFNHNRLLTCSLYPHLHVLQNSSIIPNILLAYRYQYNGLPITTEWTYMKCNNPVFSYTAGSTIHQVLATTVGITPSSSQSQLSDIVQFKIYRDVSNASTMFSSTDNLATTIRSLSFDVHYAVDTLGSRSEYSK